MDRTLLCTKLRKSSYRSVQSLGVQSAGAAQRIERILPFDPAAVAHLLVAEGFTSVEEIVETPIDELNQIEGFEEEISVELQNRAKAFLEAKQKELKEKQAELGLSDDLVEFEALKPQQILLLGENGVKSKDDLADLAGDELVEILGEDKITETQANDIIM